ncbi:MAG TPA: hypothetical protein VG125_10070 [Pirellulales bacterium]|jgi:hypothetical protein|nr:hypothetical protein [Pirellulales bacterium]
MDSHRRVVTAEPENSETPLESQSGWVTPNRLFFVRNHFHRPEAVVLLEGRTKNNFRICGPGERDASASR